MENFNKKQKILLYSIAIIIVILIIIYFFTKDKVIYSNYDNLYAQNNQNISNNTESLISNLICIYIVGEVKNPSVIKIEEGARITDVIDKAGGLTDSAEIKSLNLAYKVKDGEKIYIPSLDEVLEYEEENKKICYVSNSIESSKTEELKSESYTDNYNKGISDLININIATQTELETLNGIGPSMAKNIIDYRKENGDFQTIEDIKEVSGIGEAKFNSIKNNICVE